MQQKKLIMMALLGGAMVLTMTGCGEAAEEATTPQTQEPVVAGYVKTTSTLTINDTNLTWQDTPEVYTSVAFDTYAEASNYCATLELDNMSGWRLPTLTEYQEVLYPNKEALTYQWQEYYDEYGTYIFWSADRAEVSGEYYVRMHNISNNLSPNFKESAITFDWAVRCVRDAE